MYIILTTENFFEYDIEKRVIEVNLLLSKYETNALSEVSTLLNINYSTFCKEMSKGDYVYIKRENTYYKFIRNTSKSLLSSPDNKFIDEDFLVFLSNNKDKIKLLLNTNSIDFIIDSRVYSCNDFSNKNIKINSEIYKEFLEICELKFPFYKIQDIISQCLLGFIDKNKER